jgi:Flp pilus assembly pilin Flp
MDALGKIFEEFKVQATDLVDKVRQLINEGNVRRIIIKDHSGATFVEIPLTVATVGIVLAPVLAAVGAIATALSDFKVVVERAGPASARPGEAAKPSGSSNIGATEEQVDMKNTVGQRIDNKGTRVEDLAGTGEQDSPGG